MREEINVSLTSDHLVGTLDDYPTRSGYRITPFVFWAGKDIKPEANPGEVAIIYKVPFRELAHPEAPEFASIPESDRPLISPQHRKYTSARADRRRHLSIPRSGHFRAGHAGRAFGTTGLGMELVA